MDFSRINKAPLSPKQRGILGFLFAKAYKRAITHVATDDLKEQDWRHEQCRRMCGVTIGEARQMHFNQLRMFGEDLCGNSGRAFAVAMQMPREEATRLRHLVEEAMSKFDLSWGYMATIIKGKFDGKSLDDLNPFEWEQLLYTANNRGQALLEHREERFEPGNRNKKQRATA